MATYRERDIPPEWRAVIAPTPRQAPSRGADHRATRGLAVQSDIPRVTLEHHDEPIRQRDDLIQIARVNDNRTTRVARSYELRVHGGRGRDVQAARRVLDDHRVRLRGELAAQHELLLISTRKRADHRLSGGRAHVVLR